MQVSRGDETWEMLRMKAKEAYSQGCRRMFFKYLLRAIQKKGLCERAGLSDDRAGLFPKEIGKQTHTRKMVF